MCAADTWLVNPGTIAGIGAAPTYVLGDLMRMVFDVSVLEGEDA